MGYECLKRFWAGGLGGWKRTCFDGLEGLWRWRIGVLCGMVLGL